MLNFTNLFYQNVKYEYKILFNRTDFYINLIFKHPFKFFKYANKKFLKTPLLIEGFFFIYPSFILTLFKSIRYIYNYTFAGAGKLISFLILVLIIDSLLIDDEPIWEPLEWSLIQSWLLFIFFFSWIAENLITSRYGSFVGKDKHVWIGLYKFFWIIEYAFLITYTITIFFIITPFYYEITYTFSYIISWWDWYTLFFFIKQFFLFSVIFLISYLLILNTQWLNTLKIFLLWLIPFILLIYLFFTQFILTFFSYLTHPTWYTQTQWINYIQLSHSPLKWGWGVNNRDHFTYHITKVHFWYKNDGPFAEIFFFWNFFIFILLFLIILQYITILRRLYTLNESSITLTTYLYTLLKHYSMLIFFFFFFSCFSYILIYLRLPIDFVFFLTPVCLFNLIVDLIIDLIKALFYFL